MLLFCPKVAFREILLWRILGNVNCTAGTPKILTKVVLDISMCGHSCEGGRNEAAQTSNVRTVCHFTVTHPYASFSDLS